MAPSWFGSAGVVAFILLLEGAALADAGGQDKALAESLFDQSIALMKAGSWREACPKLAESQRLDPAPGTLLYLGDCYEKTGKVATAWATFREAAAAAQASGQGQRAELAKTRAATLEPRLPHLHLELAPDSNVEEVRLDGTALGRALWTSDLPIDPGDHVIVASAKEHKPRTVTFQAEVSKVANVAVELLEADATEAKAPPHPTLTPTPTFEPPAGSPDRPTASWRRPAGLIVAGVGVVGLGVGTAFGLTSFSKWGDAEKLCPNDRCTHEGSALADDARSAAAASTIAFTVGLVLVAAGGLLYFTSPKSKLRAGIHLRLGQGGLVGGTF